MSLFDKISDAKENFEDRMIDKLEENLYGSDEERSSRHEQDRDTILSDPVNRDRIIDELSVIYFRFVMDRLACANEFCKCDDLALQHMESSPLYKMYRNNGYSFDGIDTAALDMDAVNASIIEALRVRLRFLPVIERNAYTTFYYLEQWSTWLKTGEWSSGAEKGGLIKKKLYGEIKHRVCVADVLKDEKYFTLEDIANKVAASFPRIKEQLADAIPDISAFERGSGLSFNEMIGKYYNSKNCAAFFAKMRNYNHEAGYSEVDLDVNERAKWKESGEYWASRDKAYRKKALDDSRSIMSSDEGDEFNKELRKLSRRSEISPTYRFNIAWQMENMTMYGYLKDAGSVCEPGWFDHTLVKNLVAMNPCLIAAYVKFGNPTLNNSFRQQRTATENAVYLYGAALDYNKYMGSNDNRALDHGFIVSDKSYSVSIVDILLNYMWDETDDPGFGFRKCCYGLPRPFNLLCFPYDVRQKALYTTECGVYDSDGDYPDEVEVDWDEISDI